MNYVSTAGRFTEILHAFNSYYLLMESGASTLYRNPPLILTLSTLIYGIVSYQERNHRFQKIIKLSQVSILLGVGLAFVFTSISDIQVRFYEYYFLAGLFLASRITTKISFVCLLFLGIVYFIKFNVVWSIWDLSILGW